MTKHRLLDECLLRLFFVFSPSLSQKSIIVSLFIFDSLSFFFVFVLIFVFLSFLAVGSLSLRSFFLLLFSVFLSHLLFYFIFFQILLQCLPVVSARLSLSLPCPCFQCLLSFYGFSFPFITHYIFLIYSLLFLCPFPYLCYQSLLLFLHYKFIFYCWTFIYLFMLFIYFHYFPNYSACLYIAPHHSNLNKFSILTSVEGLQASLNAEYNDK